MGDIFKVILMGGIASLDSTAAWQIMLSQPLVNCILTGFILGDVTTGAVIGGLLQIVWGGSLPVGASAFPDSATAGVAGTGGAVFLLENMPDGDRRSVLCLSLLLSLILGVVGGKTVTYLRRWNENLVRKADGLAKSGEILGIELLHLAGITGSFVRGLVMTTFGILFVLLLGNALLPRFQRLLSSGFEDARILIWAMGVSVFSLIFLEGKSRLIPFLVGLILSALFSGRHLI